MPGLQTQLGSPVVPLLEGSLTKIAKIDYIQKKGTLILTSRDLYWKTFVNKQANRWGIVLKRFRFPSPIGWGQTLGCAFH